MKIMVEIPEDAFQDAAEFLFEELFVRQYGQPILRDLAVEKKAIVDSILSDKETLKDIAKVFLTEVVDYYGDEFQDCFDIDRFPEVEEALDRCWTKHRDIELNQKNQQAVESAAAHQQWINNTIAELKEYGYEVVKV